jgi:hypothetical protein
MAHPTDVVLILGSGLTAPRSSAWPRGWFDKIVAINNAWRIRPDWDACIFPEDFPADRRPNEFTLGQSLVEADRFVPAQNAFGGFVYAGGTMAFTAAYWALHVWRPRVMAFLGCDMVYPEEGPTHFYGTGAADPLREDVTLQDLKAKSARLGLMAALQDCACVNLSTEKSELLFPRAGPETLRRCRAFTPNKRALSRLLDTEQDLGYYVPSGRYWEQMDVFDDETLAELDAGWRAAWMSSAGRQCAA